MQVSKKYDVKYSLFLTAIPSKSEDENRFSDTIFEKIKTDYNLVQIGKTFESSIGEVCSSS